MNNRDINFFRLRAAWLAGICRKLDPEISFGKKARGKNNKTGNK